MKKILLALALLFAPSLASAQCTGVFPANTVCGNFTASPAPPSAVSISASGIIGPGSSTVGHFATWGNTLGTLLADFDLFGTGNTFTAGQTFSGVNTFSNTNTFSSATFKLTGIAAGTQTSCLGLDASNVVVKVASACNSASGSLTSITQGANTTAAPGAGVALSTTPCVTTCVVSIDASYMRGFLSGLIMSNDVGSPNTVIDTAIGVATSDDATSMMKLSSAYTKTTGSWAVGSANGCLDTGSVAASTWYHLFVILRPDTGVVDQLCSVSATAPTMPANYTKKRRIGSFKTDVSVHIIPFYQNNDYFEWGVAQLTGSYDYLGIAPVATRITISLVSVPSGVRVGAVLNIDLANPGPDLVAPVWYLSSPDSGYVSASGGQGLGTIGYDNATGSAAQQQHVVWTNTSAQIYSKVFPSAGSGTNADVVAFIQPQGWYDTRGK